MRPKDRLPRAQIQQIRDAAIRAGLDQSRKALLSGIDQGFVSTLHHSSNPGEQLLLDLSELNRVEMLADGAVPLIAWLTNAEALAGPRAEAAVFHVALEALKIMADVPRAPTGANVTPTVRVLLDLGVEEFWPDPRASALHKVLKVAYGDVASIKQIASLAGVDTSEVSLTGGAGDIWFDLLTSAIRAAKIRRLLGAIVEDDKIAFYRPQIQRILA
jgi:effector-associated domain 5 (EAD5)-containing protein/effector-associated domain 1 (EAD1)-containing protein